MIRQAKLAYLVIGLLAIPFVASAQTRVAPARPARVPVQIARPNAVVPAPVRPATGTRPRIIRLPAAPAAQRTGSSSQMASTPNIAVFPNGTNGFIFPGATSFDLSQLMNNNGAPGFGFDFTHLAALNGNLGEKAFIDPVTQQDIALAEQLARSSPGFVGGFIPFWGGEGYSEPIEGEPQAQQQQPQVIVLQQPVPATNSASASSSETAPVESQPPPDVGIFTLVLRNGDKIKAVAFSRQKDQIVYITKEGARSSFAAADLDVAATEQLNQDHGTPLHLSL